MTDPQAPISVRYVINDAIEEYVREHPDFRPHDPDDVKMLSRHVRDRLLENYDPNPIAGAKTEERE